MEKQLLKNLFELFIKEDVSLDFKPYNTPSLDTFVECIPQEIIDNFRVDLSYKKPTHEDYVEAYGFYFFKMFYVYAPEHQEWFLCDSKDGVTEKLSRLAPELEDEFNFESPEDRNSDR